MEKCLFIERNKKNIKNKIKLYSQKIKNGNNMKLYKHFPYANIYGDDRKQRTVLGGVPNIPIDIHGNLAPMDNELEIVTTHPQVKYLVKRGPFTIGFHNKNNNKYLVGLQLRTGETMKITLPDEPAVTPTLNTDNRTIKWNYSWGWVRQYAIENEIKEVIKQNAGKEIKFRYVINGLTPQNNGDDWNLLRNNGKLAFKIPKPYYIIKINDIWEFDGYVPYTKQKIDNNTWELILPAPAEDKFIDPTIVFGEGGGVQIGGDHKNTFIQGGAPVQSFGNDLNLYVTTLVNTHTLMRFSLVNHIPPNAIVNTSTMRLYTRVVAGPFDVSIYRLITNWGITPIDEGISQNPAALGQATHRRSFDFNGAGGDVAWAAGNFSAADHDGIAEDVQVCNAVNTNYFWDIPNMTQLWVNNDNTNYGMVLQSTAGGANSFDSQRVPVLADRPYLTVDYTIPGRIVSSHIALPGNLGIM